MLPENLRQGIGRRLFGHAVERARALGFGRLTIESDPNAEAFYQKIGAHRVGVRSTQLDGECRELPLLLYEIDRVQRILSHFVLVPRPSFLVLEFQIHDKVDDKVKVSVPA